MRVILAAYAIMFVAGLLTAHFGISLICVGVAAFFIWADKQMDKHPPMPVRPKSTMEILDEYCCECCNPTSPRQISFPDSVF